MIILIVVLVQCTVVTPLHCLIFFTFRGHTLYLSLLHLTPLLISVDGLYTRGMLLLFFFPFLLVPALLRVIVLALPAFTAFSQ